MTDIRILETPEDFSLYDTWVKEHPQGSLWQSLEWKSYQEALGREVRIYIAEDSSKPSPQPSPLKGRGCSITASALVVIDRTTGGWSTWDVPRGPLWTANSDERLAARVLEQVVEDAKKNSCLALSLSPPQILPTCRFPLVASQRHEQPSATRMIDLTKSEEEILAQMHPKGRYNIRVAQKHGVRIEHSDDIEAFYGLLQQTAERDGFRILPLKAYKTFLECLPGGFLLLAFLLPSPFVKGEGQGERVPIAGLMGTIWPPAPHPSPLPRGEGRMGGIYYYGASDYAHRALMAPYALQWEAMRLCKGKGCTTYDLLGVAPSAPLTLPSPAGRGNTAPHPALSPSDRVSRAGRGERELPHPWAGVSAFKEKFGGTVVISPPEQQIILRPVLWKVLQWKRWMIG